MSFGCVVKNHDLKISFTTSRREVISAEPVMAELLAIKWSLRMEKDLQMSRLITQSDAKLAVDCINGVISHAILKPVAEDCRIFLKSF